MVDGKRVTIYTEAVESGFNFILSYYHRGYVNTILVICCFLSLFIIIKGKDGIFDAFLGRQKTSLLLNFCPGVHLSGLEMASYCYHMQEHLSLIWKNKNIWKNSTDGESMLFCLSILWLNNSFLFYFLDNSSMNVGSFWSRKLGGKGGIKGEQIRFCTETDKGAFTILVTIFIAVWRRGASVYWSKMN